MPRILLLLLTLVMAAFSVNSLEQSYSCPLCGAEWTQRIETSSRPTGMRLDLRQLGDVVDPPTLPQCPKCRFVVFSEKLSTATLEKLKPFVQGQDYQLLAAKSPTYFCLAQIQTLLKAPPRFIAQSYLRAAWQVEDKDAIANRYLAAAAEQSERAIRSLTSQDKAYPDIALLHGEVLRRLSRFAESAQHFRDLSTQPVFQEAKRQQIIAQQLSLIERKDNQPQQLREPGATGQEPVPLPDPTVISVKKPSPAAANDAK